MEGYLEKRGRGKKLALVRPWARRFFILRDDDQTLSYYLSANPEKRESEFKGQFDLKGATIADYDADKEFAFSVRCERDGEVLSLAASSKSERSSWVNAIIAASVNHAQPRTNTPPPAGGNTKGHVRQNSVSLEFNDLKSSPVPLVYRKTGTQFRAEMEFEQDKNLALNSKMKNFDTSRMVDLLKVNLCSRDSLGNIDDSNVYSSASFLVSLNLLLREDILHQLGIQNVGPDDISPVLVKCFAIAMVGLSRISLEIFDLIDKYITDLTDIDVAIIENHRALAEQSFEWCLAHKYVDKPLTCNVSIKIKIALYGFVATGKTSLLFRYIDDVFHSKTASTIGVDFRQKKLSLDMDGSIVSCLVDVWDTAGQEKYRAMTSNFIKGTRCLVLLIHNNFVVLIGADGVFIVYDASDENCGDPEEQREGLTYLVAPDFPTVLFGNKSDLFRTEKRMMQLKVMQSKKKASHFIGSALSGENVEEAFEHLVRKIAKIKIRQRQEEMDLKEEESRKTIKLNRTSFKAPSSKSVKDCC